MDTPDVAQNSHRYLQSVELLLDEEGNVNLRQIKENLHLYIEIPQMFVCMWNSYPGNQSSNPIHNGNVFYSPEEVRAGFGAILTHGTFKRFKELNKQATSAL